MEDQAFVTNSLDNNCLCLLIRITLPKPMCRSVLPTAMYTMLGVGNSHQKAKNTGFILLDLIVQRGQMFLIIQKYTNRSVLHF